MGGLDGGEWGRDMVKSKGKSGLRQIKRQIAKGKRQKFVRKQSPCFFRFSNAPQITKGKIKRKIKCRPFAFCDLPFAF
jgi:hypothetical protein